MGTKKKKRFDVIRLNMLTKEIETEFKYSEESLPVFVESEKDLLEGYTYSYMEILSDVSCSIVYTLSDGRVAFKTYIRYHKEWI